MRIGRSVIRIFGISVLPAVTGALVAYFGYFAILGERGVLALADVQARLAVQHDELARLQANRARLEHRIELMRPGSVDNDLVEELARTQFMEGGPGQIAVPRTAH